MKDERREYIISGSNKKCTQNLSRGTWKEMNNVWGCERGSPASGHSSVACSCEHGKESDGSIKDERILGLDSAPCIQVLGSNDCLLTHASVNTYSLPHMQCNLFPCFFCTRIWNSTCKDSNPYGLLTCQFGYWSFRHHDSWWWHSLSRNLSYNK